MTRDDYMIGQVNVVANALINLVLLLGRRNPEVQGELAEIMTRMQAETVALNELMKKEKEGA